LVTQITGTGLVSTIWLTQAWPLTLPLGRPSPVSSRAIHCAASVEIGGNRSSILSNSSPTAGLAFRNHLADLQRAVAVAAGERIAVAVCVLDLVEFDSLTPATATIAA